MHDETRIPFIRTSINDIRRGNIETHQSCKEQANGRINKDGKKYVKQNILDIKLRNTGKRKTKVIDESDQVRRRNRLGGHAYQLTDGHRVSQFGNLHEGNRSRGRPTRCWRDQLDYYWKGTIWQRIRKIGRCGSNMLRLSPNHGALWLHKDDAFCSGSILFVACFLWLHLYFS